MTDYIIQIQDLYDQIKEKLLLSGYSETDSDMTLLVLHQNIMDEVIDELDKYMDEEQKNKLSNLSETASAEELMNILGMTNDDFLENYAMRLENYLANLDTNIEDLKAAVQSQPATQTQSSPSASIS